MTDLHIYTEGDQQRGLGHLTRCSAYAAAWCPKYGNVRWVVDGDEAARRMLGSVQAEWRAWQHDPVTEPQEAVAIVDSYSATLPVLQSIAANYRRVVYLDDTCRLPYPAGLVVHAAPGEPQAVEGEAEWLWGPSWQPLRPAFWNIPKRTHVAERVGRILVLMGGTDLHNLTPRMVALAHEVYPDAEIHAVMGSQSRPDITGCITHKGLNDAKMAMLMCGSDLAISAGGQSVFELAKCGTPALLICVADNQEKQLREWPKLGAFIFSGWWNDSDLDRKILKDLSLMEPIDYRKQSSKHAQEAMYQNGTVATCRLLSVSH